MDAAGISTVPGPTTAVPGLAAATTPRAADERARTLPAADERATMLRAADQPATLVQLPRTVVLSTYVPSQCGIATFAGDLVQGLRAGLGPDAPVRVAALDSPAAAPVYPPEVRYRLRADDRRAYRRLAADLEADGAEVLCLQHEYGLFGGPSGRHVLDLLERLSIPVVTTLHTILTTPTRSQARILRATRPARPGWSRSANAAGPSCSSGTGPPAIGSPWSRTASRTSAASTDPRCGPSWGSMGPS